MGTPLDRITDPAPMPGRWEPEIDFEARLYEEAGELAEEWLNDFECVAETYDERLLPESLARMVSVAHSLPGNTEAQRHYRDQLYQAIGAALVAGISRLAYEDAVEDVRERARA